MKLTPRARRIIREARLREAGLAKTRREIADLPDRSPLPEPNDGATAGENSQGDQREQSSSLDALLGDLEKEVERCRVSARTEEGAALRCEQAVDLETAEYCRAKASVFRGEADRLTALLDQYRGRS